jgi:hypothetical protein
MIKIKTNILSSLLAIVVFLILVESCKKDDEDKNTVNSIDAELFEMSKSANGFTWYKKTSDLLEKSSGTGHPQTFLRTRFNSIASTMLDSDGKIMNGISFPEGALIVKELYSDANTLGRYAILFKQTASTAADERGWVWGYINAGGDVSIAASKKGVDCKGCHSQEGNIDYMLMNKFFP